MTKFQQAQDEVLAVEIEEFVTKANAAYTASVEDFAVEVEKRGPFQAMRWKAEGLLAAEMMKDLATVVSAINVQEESTPTEAIAAGQRYLRSQVEEGVRSSWSGYITNEAMKARAKAALDLESHGEWAYMVSGAKYQASHRIAPQGKLIGLRSDYRAALGKVARCRAEETLAKAEQDAERIAAAVAREVETVNALLVEAGAPEEVLVTR